MVEKVITIGLILLFLFCNVSITTLSDGNGGNLSGETLYVGGSGPGNYTKIQDAIDNATYGDTIFVYNGTYYENLLIEKNLELYGENRENTIIFGYEKGWAVRVFAQVTISGFTITSNNVYGAMGNNGLRIKSDYNRITNNIIKENWYSLDLIESDYNNISNNIISSWLDGIYLSNCKYNTIWENIVKENYCGLIISGGEGNRIIGNIIIRNGAADGFYLGSPGMYIGSTYRNYIYNNHICDNPGHDIYVRNSTDNKLICNNIEGIYSEYSDNYWDGNHWDRALWKNMLRFPKIIFMKETFQFDVDWHPARYSYDIQVPETTVKKEPVISNPYPSDYSSVQSTLTELRFDIYDAQGDLMDYTVETSPDIGSKNGYDVSDGTIIVPVSGLKDDTWYRWYVNLTDGVHWTREVFTFFTFTGELGLVGYWSFDEGDGNTAHDSSGNDNHGTIHGASWTTGISGNAIDFDGDGDYVDIHSNFGLTDHWTFATWVKVHHQDPGIIISLPYTYNAAGIELGTYHKEDKTFRVRNYHTLEEYCIQTSLTDITDGSWYHCAATYDGATQKIFVNGIEEDSDPMSKYSRVYYGRTYIGAFSDWYNDGWNGLNGTIDEVRIYNRALSENEIFDLYTKLLV